MNLGINNRHAVEWLGPRGILVLDLANRISGLAKGNQHRLSEVDTFFVTFRDLVPRRAVPRTGMINESGFDGVCYDDEAVFWHSGSLHVSCSGAKSQAEQPR
jgi:hypothetical protein